MSPGLIELRDFATRYTAAWCSRNPAMVAAFFSEDGSLTVNDDLPSVGRDAITRLALSFMRAFPDLQVVEDLQVRGPRGGVPLDSYGNECRAGRERPQGTHLRIRKMALRWGQLDQLIARQFRCDRVLPAVGKRHVPRERAG